MGLT
ncbi:hypothetical protein D030_0074A, partial [Vibrio parahaemolyticus AQ3810]|jgi:hypothetical protein